MPQPDLHSKLLDAIADPRVREQVRSIIDLSIGAVKELDSINHELFWQSIAYEKVLKPVPHTVLCVLSAEQRDEFREELERLRGGGIVEVHESEPEVALSMILEVDPWLVIVGLEIGYMEGLEFVALLMRKHPDFDRNILVLPNKGDPFPPVMQSRDTNTGRSKTESVSLEEVWRLVAEAEKERQEKTHKTDKRHDLEGLAESMLEGARALDSHLKTQRVSLDYGTGGEGEGEGDFEFDLGGSSEPEEMSMDDDDISGALDGLVPHRRRGFQEVWNELSVEISTLSHALSSELRDFDQRFQRLLDGEHFLQALRYLCGVCESLVDGVFALMSAIAETYLDAFDRDDLLPGHKDALGKALLVRRGLADLRRVVSKDNRQIQDTSKTTSDRESKLDRLCASLSAFLESEVFAAMRPADRLELKRFEQRIIEQPLMQGALASEGLDKYLDSLLLVNQREVLIKHDREIMNEVTELLEGVASLIEISPVGAEKMVRESFAQAQALRGYRDDLDELLRKWGQPENRSPSALVVMGSQLAALLGAP